MSVMENIHKKKVRMRPKIYFVIGSLLTFTGLVFSIITSVFLFGLMRFSLRVHSPMGGHRLELLLSSFPWWAPILAILGLIIGIWLLRQYDFSYKLNFKIMVIGMVIAIFLTGWLVDVVGINDVLLRRSPMKGMMQKYFLENNIQPPPRSISKPLNFR